jgi:uncharacterized DUF497 family protein
VRFEWDDSKATSNHRKHNVSFDEACTLFEDPYFVIFADPDHSQAESRFIIVGESISRRILVVSYVDTVNSTRLISAREATRSEREFYEEDN